MAEEFTPINKFEHELIRGMLYVEPPRKRPKKLVAAAILWNGRVWTGRRHAWIRDYILEDHPELLQEAGDWALNPDWTGFWTDDGRYVRRKPALRIARKAGQLPEGYDRGTLFSEFLWPAFDEETET
jgi:hypothetical protein